MDLQAQIRSALAEEKIDDATFASVFLGARQMTGVPFEMSEIDRAILVVRELLQLGLFP